MSHTVVHFEIPADQPERAAEFYRELFGWEIKHLGPAGSGGIDYWLVNTVPTDAEGRPTEPGVNGGLMHRMMPGQTPVNYISVENVDEFARKAERLGSQGHGAEDAGSRHGMVRPADGYRGEHLCHLAARPGRNSG